MIRKIVSALLILMLALSGTLSRAEVVYYHNDALGSPVAASDVAGQVIWRESYKPYGDRTKHQDDGKINHLWFTSKYHEEEFGLTYFGARWYSPEHMRFISMDPVPFRESNFMSFNPYTYGNNNPYRYTDPDGRRDYDEFGDSIEKEMYINGTIESEGTQFVEQYPYAFTDAVGTVALGVGLANTGAWAPILEYSLFGNIIPIRGGGGKFRGGPLTAEAAADEALLAGRNRGAAGQLDVEGKTFIDVSGEKTNLHPDLQKALDNVPESQRAPWHGHCAEIGCIDKALKSGVNPRGGKIRATNIGDSGKGHGTPKKACSTCRNVADQFNIDY